MLILYRIVSNKRPGGVAIFQKGDVYKRQVFNAKMQCLSLFTMTRRREIWAFYLVLFENKLGGRLLEGERLLETIRYRDWIDTAYNFLGFGSCACLWLSSCGHSFIFSLQLVVSRLPCFVRIFFFLFSSFFLDNFVFTSCCTWCMTPVSTCKSQNNIFTMLWMFHLPVLNIESISHSPNFKLKYELKMDKTLLESCESWIQFVLVLNLI